MNGQALPAIKIPNHPGRRQSTRQSGFIELKDWLKFGERQTGQSFNTLLVRPNCYALFFLVRRSPDLARRIENN
ncbi:MAG: hypothetical protein AB7I12_11730 [Steroidobacteraceae bacterium]